MSSPSAPNFALAIGRESAENPTILTRGSWPADAYKSLAKRSLAGNRDDSVPLGFHLASSFGGILAVIWFRRAVSDQPDRIRFSCRLCGEPCQKKCWAGSCCKEVATCYEISGRRCTRSQGHRGAQNCGAFHEEAIDGAGCDTDSESDGHGNQGKGSAKGRGSGKHLKGRSRSDATTLGTAAPEENGTEPKEIEENTRKKFTCESCSVPENHGKELLVDLGALMTQSEIGAVQLSEQGVVCSDNQLEDPPVRPPCGHCGRPCYPRNTTPRSCGWPIHRGCWNTHRELCSVCRNNDVDKAPAADVPVASSDMAQEDTLLMV